MKIIIKLSIQFSILLLSSCSSTSFINRKYTSGVFLEHNKTLKHNTVSVDSSKRYASLNRTIEFIKPAISYTAIDDKEIISTLTNSIIKKDSMFHFQRRGKDIKFIKKCNGQHVLIVLNRKNKIVRNEPLAEIGSYKKYSPKSQLFMAKVATYIALATFFIPVIGFLTSMIAISKIRQSKLNNQTYNYVLLNVIIGITTFISVLFMIGLVLLSIYAFSAIFGLHLFSAFI
jgi:hypothetical protein